MGSRDKCLKCNKVVKEGVQCGMCDCIMHAKCIGISDDCVHALSMNKCIKWFCDCCIKVIDNHKNVSDTILDCQNKLVGEFDKVFQANELIITEIVGIKKILVDEDKRSLEDVGVKFDEGITMLEEKLNESWTDIVKKYIKESINSMNSEVKSVRRRMEERDETKDRENNIIMFGLKENSSYDEDKKMMMKIFQHLSNDVVKENDAFKMRRIGKKSENTLRPVWVAFKDLTLKMVVMKNLARIKTLEEEFRKIAVRHDLTPDQKSELNKMLAEARSRQENDKNDFLYRVRGEVGKWRIIRFKKDLH